MLAHGRCEDIQYLILLSVIYVILIVGAVPSEKYKPYPQSPQPPSSIDSTLLLLYLKSPRAGSHVLECPENRFTTTTCLSKTRDENYDARCLGLTTSCQYIALRQRISKMECETVEHIRTVLIRSCTL